MASKKEYDEVKGESNWQTQSSKNVECLKKLLHDQSSSNSEEVCSLFSDLIKTVSSTTHKPNSSQSISQAIEILFFACSNQNHRIRNSASETLKKLVKELMGTHFARIQQDLFHELKKNGEPRSLCVALECFSSLFPFTRPSKCSVYAQNLIPVILRLISRHEESLHDALQDALLKILPTLSPFVSVANIKTIGDGLVSNLNLASASYRRMASSALGCVVKFSQNPLMLIEWLLNYLFDLGCGQTASLELVSGVLMTLQQLFLFEKCPYPLLKRAYCYVISCLLYRSGNADLTALECLHQLLKYTNTDFILWLTSPQPDCQIATEFWCSDIVSDDKCDTASLDENLDTPLDNYFESDDIDASISAASQEVSSLSQDNPSSTISVANCLALKNSHNEPLRNLIEYLNLNVLSSDRISAQSLGLACITSAIEINPNIMTSLESIGPFLVAQDPKLRSRVVKLLATIIFSQLHFNHGNFIGCHSVVFTAYEYLLDFINDRTPTVLKSVCEALRLCLPSLLVSTQPTRVVDIVHKLLPLGEVSYWLAKVEFLQTLGCLDYTILSLFDNKIPKVILNQVVFKLIGDSDYRVRAMACECLVSLASSLTLDGNSLLAHTKIQSAKLFSHCLSTSIEFSFAGIAETLVRPAIPPPIGLDHVLWFLQFSLSSSGDLMIQRGCLEALHVLSIHYPPASLPSQWGCSKQPSSIVRILHDLLESSRLGWGVQGQSELLELSGSVFLSCAIVSMKQQSSSANPVWGALDNDTLVQFATFFLSHNVILLSVFVHIVEQREPEIRDKKIQIGVSPKKQGNVEMVSSNKSRPAQILQESLNIKPPIVPKDGIGYFANSPHLMKIYDACKAAYTNFQISLDPIGTDKFSKLLQMCHKSLAILFEIAFAIDVGKYVEEILLYMSYTVKIDPSGALLCVQQLLNALFGMNIAAQHTHLYSPFISSLNFVLDSPQLMDDELSFYGVAVANPIDLMKKWLIKSASSEEMSDDKKGFLPIKKALIMKPINSASEIRDYIAYFEPLVVYALNQFPYTSSLLLQQRVLFLVVQLMHLKVRYDLLDCNHSFFESVKKLIGLMETGMVKGGEALVPHLFQFLVLLASDQSKLVTIPQVIQMCDGVMASGHNVITFAIPALQPLVLSLFVRSTRLSSDLDIQREVALNMLLRVIEHPRVIVLLTQVLDFYRRKKTRWQEVSNKIYAALLPRIGKLQVVLESKESHLAIYQLLMAMCPKTVTLPSLLTAIIKQTVITSSANLLRWLAMLSLLLELMVSVFSESDISSISSLHLSVPQFKSPFVSVPGQSLSEDGLALFLHHSLFLAAKTLYQVGIQKCSDEYQFLPTLIGNMLVLLQILLQDYVNLKRTFSLLPDYDSLNESFVVLSSYFPLLTLHYINFMLLVKPDTIGKIENVLCNNCSSSSSMLVQHGAILSICSKYSESMKGLLLSIARSPTLITHHDLNLTCEFLRIVQCDTDTMNFLFSQLKLTGSEPPRLLQQYLCIASNALSPKTVKFLCAEMIPHSLSVISQAAVIVASKLLYDPSVIVEADLAEELLQDIKPYNERCPELVSKLCSISGQSRLHFSPAQSYFLPVEGDIDKMYNNKEHCVKMIANFCSAADSSRDREVCTHILSILEKDDIDDVFSQIELPLSLLESCIVYGTLLSLNLKSSLDYFNSVERRSDSNFTQDNVHPLFEVSVKHLLAEFIKNPLNCELTRCIVRLLAASHQFPRELLLDAVSINLLKDFCLCTLKNGSKSGSPLAIQNSLDCCTLALHLTEVQEGVSAEWAIEAVTSLYDLVKNVYPIKLPLKYGVDLASQADDSGSSHAKDQLLGILSVLLNRGLVPKPYTLHRSLKYFTFTLCRLSIWHGSLITPPVLKGEGDISYKILDEALMESEVLLQYMQRCNSLGWLTRFQFEERWMQLLGVINQPIPLEDSSLEQHHAYYLNVCSGLQAITSLLLSTTLRPHMGDPTSSIPMNIHRINEMLFLGSRPGRKLANVRKRLELEILLECGTRTNVYSYYQNPLMNHYSSSLYPPLYTRNVEKEIGDTAVGYGQISLSSLWSILFKQTSPGYHSDSEEIDVKSCILSLIELYVHWLRQPVYTVLLNHVLQSVIMLSDLFAVSSHYKWMLQTLLDLYDTHPHEDAHTLALIVVGILKVAAILKSESIDTERAHKIIEKSLSSNSILQTACIRGVLYLSEETNSSVMPSCIPAVTKYTIMCFQNFQSYTEDHLMTLWSLSVKIITDHSQHLKNNFTSRILELITQIMIDQTISTAFFHSITLGLELLVLNFSLSAQERTSVINSASSRFVKSDHNKSLIALSLLLSCMYTGEEADVASGVAEPSFNPMETAIQAREQVNNLMERLRHGPEVNITFIVDILPKIIIDFLPPMEVLQTVVTDFVSPHQSRPRLSASIMAETFALLIKNGHQAILAEWILLSLDSFVQQEPEAKAVWSLTCLLLAASTNDVHHLFFLCICHWKHVADSLALQLLCVSAKHFYTNQCDENQQRQMIDKFKESTYASLLQVSQYCSI